MDAVMQDLRYAVRALTKAPAFTVTIVLTLALGIGANTAVFSALYGVLLRPFPYPHPERLVEFSYRYEGFTGPRPATYAQFQYLLHNATALEALAAATGVEVNLSTGGAAAHLHLERVSSDYFSVLDVAPILGRTFSKDEDQTGGRNVAILSHGLWQRSFGGDAAVLGRSVLLDGTPFTVIGVMPAGFEGPDPADLWSTVGQVTSTIGSGQNLDLLGRLPRNAAVAQSRARLVPVLAAFASTFHSGPTTQLGFTPIRELRGAPVEKPLVLLFGAIAAVLLIACANVAGLLLGRGSARGRELAVRATLGATRWRLMRQLLAESLVLSAFGAGVGVAMAGWGIAAVRALEPPGLPRLADIRIDGRVLVFSAALAVATGLGFGIVPAWRAVRMDLKDALQEAADRTTAGLRLSRLRHALVTGEIALSLVLLVGAGLLLRTFTNLLRSDIGFDPRRVLAAEFWLTGSRHRTAPDIAAYYDDLLRRATALPGVTTAGIVEAGVPLMRGGNVAIRRPGEAYRSADYRGVTLGYFETVQVPLLNGREFTSSDNAAGEPVAVVNQTFARRILAGGDALGASVEGPDLGRRRVVGVVGDVTSAIGAPANPTIFIPTAQESADLVSGFNGWFPIHMMVRVAGDPSDLAGTLSRTLQAADADVPIGRVQAMTDVLADGLALRRFALLLAGLFAGLAALLAGVGVYGLLAYLVVQRTREIGIRMALGARRRQVLALVARHASLLVGTGLAGGVLGAALATRLLESQLYGVRPLDLPTFALVTLGIALIAALAAYLPARRATRVDPMIALRTE